jgi:hypothetical protein
VNERPESLGVRASGRKASVLILCSTPQHSGHSSRFAETVAGVVWNELERAGVGAGERIPKPCFLSQYAWARVTLWPADCVSAAPLKTLATQ